MSKSIHKYILKEGKIGSVQELELPIDSKIKHFGDGTNHFYLLVELYPCYLNQTVTKKFVMVRTNDMIQFESKYIGTILRSGVNKKEIHLYEITK